MLSPATSQVRRVLVRWTPEERATYTASLGLTGWPAAPAVRRFVDDTLADAELPPPWFAKRDFEGRLFFSNPNTAESSWVHPLDGTLRELAHICIGCLGFEEKERDTRVHAMLSQWTSEVHAEVAKWYAVPDKKGKKKTYYCHSQTQEVSWERPEKLASRAYDLKLRALGKLLDSSYVRGLMQAGSAPVAGCFATGDDGDDDEDDDEDEDEQDESEEAWDEDREEGAKGQGPETETCVQEVGQDALLKVESPSGAVLAELGFEEGDDLGLQGSPLGSATPQPITPSSSRKLS
ncbi:unnamed protein product, partial [Polarella glacialis]